MHNRTLKTRNCVAYGMGDMYGGGSFFIVSTFSLFFLINVAGLNPLIAGLIPGLGKVWDACSDPLMGWITDRTRSRFGRRRIYFLAGIIPIIASFTLLWVSLPAAGQGVLFLYYFGAFIFFYTTTTMVMVPYSALSAEMTRDFTSRNRLAGFRMVFSMFATLLAGVAAQPIIDAFTDQGRGHLDMGFIFSLIFALPWVFVFLGTWELPVSQAVPRSRAVFRSFISVLRNRTFRIHIVMYIASYAAMDIMMAWLKFYLHDYLQKPHLTTVSLGIILITQMAALPLYVAIANRRGHAAAYRIGMTIWALAIVLISFQGSGTPDILLFVTCFAIGSGMSAGVIIPYLLLPFSIDVDELMTGEHRAGIYSGAMTLLRKLIQGALVLPLLGLLLSIIGYLPQEAGIPAVQSPETVLMLRILFISLPVISMSIGIIGSLRMHMTPRNHRILKELSADIQEGRTPVKESLDVCIALTGMSLSELPRFHYGEHASS